MAFSVKTGSILAPAATGSQGYTGVGFQPKALIFFTEGRVGGADAATDRMLGCIGCATSSSNRWVFAFDAVDNQANADANNRYTAAACVMRILGSATVDIKADLVSMDADGFTLNFSATINNTVIYYLALGGSDLSAFAGIVDIPNSGSSVAETGVGFQPSGLFMVHGQDQTDNTNLVDGTLGVAFTDGSGQGTNFVTINDGDTASISKSAQVTSAVFQHHSPFTGTIGTTAAFSSFDADGFTLSVASPSNVFPVGYLALAGVQIKAGSFSQKTSTGTDPITGVGFQPSALLLSSFGNTATASVVANATLSFGAATAAASSGVGFDDRNGSGTMINARIHSATYAYQVITAAATGSSSTLNARASVDSLDSNGFTMDYETADAVAREILYLALGSADAAITKTGSGVAGLIGAGTSSSEFAESGFGKVGTTASGDSEFIGAVVYTKAGHGVVGLVGSGVGQRITASVTYTKAGFGKVGTTTAGDSTLHEDVVPLGVSIAFGSTLLDPYPVWTRIDPERP